MCELSAQTTLRKYHADINCWMRCGYSPSQSGFWAVLSKIDEVISRAKECQSLSPDIAKVSYLNELQTPNS
ncbi:hypothetical protein [Nostoc sp. ChiQUE01b]|uniref:hypothetical protein n=1 Tax=Nostoc sp. ChiQUE01b TaxID=3075376 RepID=UPI002AD58EC3|nr:hypothetical protein [Nostoc sp. ChiQUE01b]MDZ8257407.1 hypothetical protein [Nostoc sp. ChiQUE01b]